MNLFRHLARAIRGPRCHLDAEEKAWVERRMLWLGKQFGSEPIRRAPLDPASRWLPKKWNGTPEAGTDLFQRLTTFMNVDPRRLLLQFYEPKEEHRIGSDRAGEWHKSGPAGMYIPQQDTDQLVIALERSGLQQPAQFAATICHELAHVHLLADWRIARDEPDGEPLTDLLTVYFGAGLLTANAAFQFNQWQSHNRQGWSASRQGYLSEAQYGYALACYSWYRGDLKAGWRKHLRQNIAYYFDDSLHFLAKTRDTTIPFDGA